MMPDLWLTTIVEPIAYILLVLGLIGAVVPVVPGPLLIWLGAFFWATADGFNAVGWPTLVVLGLLALLAWGSDLFMTTVRSRRAGASWKAIGAAIVGGLIGGITLTFGIPLFGTLLGAVVGAAVGIWLIEYLDKGDSRAALQAMRAYVGSMILSSFVEFGFVLLMTALFAAQAFWFV